MTAGTSPLRIVVENCGSKFATLPRRGHATAPARLSPAIRPDTVFMPFHYAGAGRANTVTNAALDPVSRMPEFKICAARVVPAIDSRSGAIACA